MQVFRNRISQYATIADDVWGMLDALSAEHHTLDIGNDIIREGEKARKIFILEEGWAIRFRMLEDGRRQIVNFMLPGDLFDLQSLADLEADHTVTTITRAKITVFEIGEFVDALRNSGEIASAFWWAAVQEESILREQIVRIGRRSAKERIGHLLLELHRRLAGALGKSDETLPLPVTRTELADSLGLTPVHVSRTMTAMRQAELIDERRREVIILDRPKLSRLSHFDVDYLHLRRLDLSRKWQPEATQTA